MKSAVLLEMNFLIYIDDANNIYSLLLLLLYA